MIIKIAVDTNNGKTISAHFGRSPYFAIFQIDDGEIINPDCRISNA
ncbi:MAG: hypothetical protein GWN16_03325 [Calditrichae bacterium]|nr:hypothetical protein [Calditrichia bacterium]